MARTQKGAGYGKYSVSGAFCMVSPVFLSGNILIVPALPVCAVYRNTSIFRDQLPRAMRMISYAAGAPPRVFFMELQYVGRPPVC